MTRCVCARLSQPILFALVGFSAVCVLCFLAVSAAQADNIWEYDEIDWVNDVEYVRFDEMQATDGLGNPTWQIPTLSGYEGEPQAYKLRGVVLNDPSKMVDGAANYAYNVPGLLGGQWQVYIQAVDSSLDPSQPVALQNDTGGAALWMGQNYGNLMQFWGGVFKPENSYQDNGYWSDGDWYFGWNEEKSRLNTARGTITEPLRPGDLIEVRARTGLAHYGKFNCNEQHDNDPCNDFDIVVIARDVPITPTSITLGDVMDGPTSFSFAACESYQATSVMLHDVTILDSSGWDTYGEITVTDSENHEFSIKLGYNTAFDLAGLPSGPLDIVGIFDQESSDLTSGYRMWVTSPTDFIPLSAFVPGDANGDWVVDQEDAARLARCWGNTGDVSWFDGDFNGDQRIDAADVSIMAANWGNHTGAEGSLPAVPEPSLLVLLAGPLWIMISRRAHRKVT